MKISFVKILICLLLPAAGAGCARRPDNDLQLARVYQARGRTGDAYNALKRHLDGQPDRRVMEELERLSAGVSPDLSFLSPAVSESLDRDEILQLYLEESRRKLREYEELYSHFPISGLDGDEPAPVSELFPVTVVIDRDVLAVALVSLDDYLVLLEDVSIMYRDHLHYQNPYLMSGVMLGMRGFYREAVSQFSEAISFDSSNPRAYNNLGITYFKMGEYTQARDALLRSLELAPDNIFARNNLGLAYLQLDRVEEARESFRRVLTRDPFNLAATFYMGYSYFSAGELDRAHRFYREAAEINPTLPEVNFALGSLMARLERWDEALDYFQKTLALDSGFYRAQVSLGGVYIRKRMFEEAERTLIEAVRLEPDYAPSYYNLACVYALQGRRSAAITNLRKAVEKGFTDRDFILSDPDLDPLSDDPAFLELIGELEGMG